MFGDGFTREQDSCINAALNYGYAVILSSVNVELVSRGYLTQLGICHRSEYNQFNFGCDLMEPFRPIVDRVVFDNVSGEFDDQIKLLLVDTLNTSIPYHDGSYKLKSVIGMYVQDCLRALDKNLPVEEIEAFEAA